jgi:hypothetical protein
MFIRYLFVLFFLFNFCGCSLVGESEKGVDLIGEGGLDNISDQLTQKKVEQNPFQFKDRTNDYGLSDVKAYNIAVVDFNFDNYSDLVFIPSFFSQPLFYRFDIGSRKFIKTSSPFKESIKASFLIFNDMNKDGVIDVIVGVLNQKSELSKIPLQLFLGKREEEKLVFDKGMVITKAASTATVNLIDYNLDGFLDLFVGNWFEKFKDTSLPTPDSFITWNGKKFSSRSELLTDENRKDVGGSMFINATPTYGASVCDMDQDGFPDIVTTSTNRHHNKLWMNRYNFREKYRFFKDFGLESGVAGDPDGLINKQGGGRSFGIACADYNNDEIMDLFVGELTHNYDSEDVDKSSLLTGRTFKFPPRFYRTEYFLDSFDPNWHQADRRGIWIDINNDGLLDLIVDNSGYPPHSKLIYFEQEADHSFTNKAQEFGIDIVNPISTVVADFNRDGKMDILTSQSQIRDENIVPRLYLFENQLPLEGNKSLRFFLKGKKSNASGLNATIILKVDVNGKIENRKQSVNYSYGALPPQNEEGVHFGIAPNEKVKSIKVIWPYSRSLNQNRAGLEKSYSFNFEFKNYMNITVCEKGGLLIGRRDCN